MLPHKTIAATASLGLLVFPLLAVAYHQHHAQARADTVGQQPQIYLAQSSAKTKGAPVSVGDTVDMSRVKVVDQPEVYGLGIAPAGNIYAIVGDLLVRMNPETGKVLSILRQVD